MPKPLKTFIIYAREDAVFKNELLRQLAPFATNGLLEKWDDSHILPGEEWEKSIEKALEASHIVLMLVSADSLFSDFIQRKELRKALEQKREGVTRVIPILVRDCLYDMAEGISDLQMLPLHPVSRSLTPVDDLAIWGSRASAWAAALRQLREVVNDVNARIEAAEKILQAEAEKMAALAAEIQRAKEAAEAQKAEEAAKALVAKEAKIQREKEAKAAAERKRIKDEATWKATIKLNTIEAYENYLDEGYILRQDEAHQRIHDLTEAETERRVEQKANDKAEAARKVKDAELSGEATSTGIIANIIANNKRLTGLEDAIKRLEISVRSDDEELAFQRKKANVSEGQLEAQIRGAKIKMIEERVVGKREQLVELTKTLADVQGQTSTVHQREARIAAKVTERQEIEMRKAAIKLEIETETAVKAQKGKEVDPFQNHMILIKGGTFDMGDALGDGSDIEKPIHKVTVQDFLIGKYPVTQAQWNVIMGDNPSFFKGDELPVEQISWNEIQRFIQKLNEKTGKKYRLPTEAEWEFAAREGGKKVRFGNGKDIADPKEMNFDATKKYKQSYSIEGEYREKTTPVNQFKPNALGLYDMSGNVWEWCKDVWHDSYKDAPDDGSAWEQGGNDQLRVIRGGSWSDIPENCRVAERNGVYPLDSFDFLGFRVVRGY